MDTSFMYDPIRLPFKGEHTVCAAHFEDSALREYINRHGESHDCSFCGRYGKAMDFADFIGHVQMVIRRYFGTLDEENLPSDFFHDDNWGFGFVRESIEAILPTEGVHSLSTAQLLQELDLITDNESLNDAIESCFDMGQEWIRHNLFSFSEGEWVSYYWESFCSTIKSSRRFTIDEYEFEGDQYEGTLTYSDVISRIFSAIRDAGLITTIHAGTRFFRSRPFSAGKVPDGFDDLTAPPSEYAKQNRMSPAGISMFYGAATASTTIAEIGAVDGNVYTGRFTSRKDLRILDLTMLPRLSYWLKSNIGELAFLQRFAAEVSHPIERDERIHTEYLPTQAFTEYVRYRFNDDKGAIDGIAYSSSVEKGGKNFVLFCNHESSRDWLELTDFKENVR